MPYLDHVPPSDLHLTVDRVGFEDEVAPEVLAGIEGLVRVACSKMAPFTVAVGPVAGSKGAIRLSVTPWRPILALKEAARRATLGSMPTAAADPGEFLPHIGIAYCNGEVSSQELIDTARTLRNLPTVKAEVFHMTLVRLTRLQGAWAWEPLQAVPFGSGAERR
jgi:2'-5' RNA ligase